MGEIILKVKVQQGKNPRIKADTLKMQYPDEPQGETMVVGLTSTEHGTGNNFFQEYEEKQFPSSMLGLLKLEGGKTTVDRAAFNPVLMANSDLELA